MLVSVEQFLVVLSTDTATAPQWSTVRRGKWSA